MEWLGDLARYPALRVVHLDEPRWDVADADAAAAIAALSAAGSGGLRELHVYDPRIL